ncbi:hypothetical protein CYMTET_52215, partial [Cymbomonas tetramitiformis]
AAGDTPDAGGTPADAKCEADRCPRRQTRHGSERCSSGQPMGQAEWLQLLPAPAAVDVGLPDSAVRAADNDCGMESSVSEQVLASHDALLVVEVTGAFEARPPTEDTSARHAASAASEGSSHHQELLGAIKEQLRGALLRVAVPAFVARHSHVAGRGAQPQQRRQAARACEQSGRSADLCPSPAEDCGPEFADQPRGALAGEGHEVRSGRGSPVGGCDEGQTSQDSEGGQLGREVTGSTPDWREGREVAAPGGEASCQAAGQSRLESGLLHSPKMPSIPVLMLQPVLGGSGSMVHTVARCCRAVKQGGLSVLAVEVKVLHQDKQAAQGGASCRHDGEFALKEVTVICGPPRAWTLEPQVAAHDLIAAIHGIQRDVWLSVLDAGDAST